MWWPQRPLYSLLRQWLTFSCSPVLMFQAPVAVWLTLWGPPGEQQKRSQHSPAQAEDVQLSTPGTVEEVIVAVQVLQRLQLILRHLTQEKKGNMKFFQVEFLYVVGSFMAYIL